jgi:ERCC4-related helicase
MEYITHPWIQDNTIERREYQEKVVASAVDGNTLAVLPTGLGKTPIAVMVAAYKLQKDMNTKILFMAPTRPLVEQHRRTFDRCMKIGLEMKVITGEITPEDRTELYKKNDIIFSTPQTIRNDLKKRRLSLEEFSLCVFDEAHRAVGNYAYPYVAKVYTDQSKDPLILALTASPGAERYKIEEVKRLLYIKNVEIKSREDKDVKSYVQEVEQTIVETKLTEPMNTIRNYLNEVKGKRLTKLLSWRIIHSTNVTKTQLLKLQGELAKKKKGYTYAAMSIIAEVLKLDHALLLLETQSIHSLRKYFDTLVSQDTKAVQRLLAEDSVKNAMRLAVQLEEEGKEHPKIAKLKEILVEEIKNNKDSRIMVFAQYRDTINAIYEEIRNTKNISAVQFIGQAKKAGKGLNQKEQMQILNEFKLGFHNVLVASSVAEEGLDVAETNVVVFYEPTPSAVRSIQRSGRTARTQKGKVVILITKGTRDETYHWVAYNKQKKMKNILYGMAKNNSLKSFG